MTCRIGSVALTVVVSLVGAASVSSAPERTTVGTILFDVHDGGSSVYVVRSNGTGLRALTPSSGDSSNPDWSPDGKKIAYVSIRHTADAGIPTLWVMNADGSKKRQLTRQLACADCSVRWSPDGTRIAFIRQGCIPGPLPPNCFSNTYSVWVVNADGGHARAVTRGPDDHNPSWSPDGKQIAFESVGLPPRSSNAIWVVKADGTHKRVLVATPSDGSVSAPTWSPTGKWIAYVRFAGSHEIWLITPQGRSMHLLTRAASGMAWSPDARRLAFTNVKRASGPIAPVFRGGRIGIIESDGTVRRTVSARPGYLPAWSPDGTVIAYAYYDDDVELEDGRARAETIRLVTSNGQRDVRIAQVRSEFSTSTLSWRPTG